ncbi:MAG TPA: NTP transferase domain-containing protein, partial [Acidimicrobiales bacterium]|nr:NTP transferase domain-containing protein [Acidimicrobiales bacterium]
MPRATLPAPFGSDAEDAHLGNEVVLIPVKAFQQAKRRLGPALADADRVQLVRAMATHVVSACAPLPVAVVCDDEEVARWASDLGALVMWEPGQGLNGAVRAGVDRLARAGASWVTVAHGDLPRARGLGTLPPFEGVTLVPDRRDDGTNVLRLQAAS